MRPITLIKPWYHANSETPDDIYLVDNLGQEVQKMIAGEAFAGLR